MEDAFYVSTILIMMLIRPFINATHPIHSDIFSLMHLLTYEVNLYLLINRSFRLKLSFSNTYKSTVKNAIYKPLNKYFYRFQLQLSDILLRCFFLAHAPRFKMPDRRIWKVVRKTTVEMSCEVDAAPEAVVRWVDANDQSIAIIPGKIQVRRRFKIRLNENCISCIETTQ